MSRGQVTEGARACVLPRRPRTREAPRRGRWRADVLRSSYQLGKQHCRGRDAATWLTEETALSCQLSFLTTDNSHKYGYFLLSFDG